MSLPRSPSPSIGLGIVATNADAGSSVVPQSGPEGKQVVKDSRAGAAKRLRTMLFKVELNGTTSYMFCIDISTSIEFGVSYDESSWNESSVPNLDKIARILAQTNALATKDTVEIAAAQAAIWHFSDGFEIDRTAGKNDAAVLARYDALVADATQNPVSSEPAGSLDVTPASATLVQGRPAFFDVATTSTAPVSIELSDAAVTAHPANGDECDRLTTINAVTGSTRICLTTEAARSNVKMTLRTGAAPVNAGRVFIRPARQKLIIGKAGAAQSSETVTASWTANGRPTVAVSCPTNGITYGADTMVSATTSDPDGDELTLQWFRNGSPIEGATNRELTTSIAVGDRISVTVTDTVGLTATAEVNCPGRNRPSVSLSCPDKVLFGASNTFTATASDPDGDAVTYVWTRNGVASTATNGPTFSATVATGDVVTVAAVDSTGLSSDAVTAPCLPPAGNHPPSVTLECAYQLTFGKPTRFTAVGTDADNDPLTYTWFVNGQPVPGVTAGEAELTVNRGDTVAVRASDGTVDSATVEVTCEGTTPNRPPTVAVACPANLIWGEPAVFTAAGSDPDDDPLTYRWTLNGKPVDASSVRGSAGERLEIAVSKGDIVAVIATDKAKQDSATVTANCVGNARPEVRLDCPSVTIAYGEPVTFTARGVDADGDTLEFAWKVNGDLVADQTAATASLVVERGDLVSVTATDSAGAASATAKVSCAGNHRPRGDDHLPGKLRVGRARRVHRQRHRP